LEYGHLTDGKGKRVNFKNTVIVLTSNIGAEEIRKNKILGFASKQDVRAERSDDDIEKAYDSMKDQLVKELKFTLRPELLNRLDDIVIFRALTRKDAVVIVRLLEDQLNKRIADHGVQVKLDEKAIKHLVKEGFSEEYGARPLRRLIQDKIESLLAQWILEKGEVEGKTVKLEITVVRGKFRVNY
jgi:ATP-dependent Clp protease ATP-binding subunit ClpC